MRILDRKLFRDLLRLWAQALAVALVMACGVATLILAVGAYRSLEETRNAFYERAHFGTVFASADHAPRYLASRIGKLSGVLALELRIAKPVILDVIGMSEPASGMIYSIPDHGRASVNQLYLRSGHLPEKSRGKQIAIMETFANAHGFQLGDNLNTIVNGKKLSLQIVGIVLSPEHIFSRGPGDMVSDERRYAVMFMPLGNLEAMFDMQGSFNDLSLTTLRGADLRKVIEEVDHILKPYGGQGAYERKDQISNAFLIAELDQLKAMSTVLPPIFLFVSAFLVNMVLSRLVALEREQVGLLKAIGYSNLAIGGHYAKLIIIISIFGILFGSVIGLWMGRALTRIYGEFFSFPFLIFQQSFDIYALAAIITVIAGLLGAAKSIWSIVVLPPAIAMRPPAPTKYKSWFKGRLSLTHYFSQLRTMAFRHLVRRPVRFAMTTFGTSLSVALLVTALFSYDSIDYMIDIVFFQSERHDAMLTFSSDRGYDAVHRVLALPGVMRVEPFRATPVKLRNANHELQMAITALPNDSRLAKVLDHDMKPMQIPPVGIVVSDRVANKLQVDMGQMVEVELTRENNRRVNIPVTGIAESYVGLTAYISFDAFGRMMRNGSEISGARIKADTKYLDALYAAVKVTPGITSIALQNLSRQNFRGTIEQNITTMMSVYVTLAVIITFGVIYNSARIQLSERARELASLRVFGFTRGEVSSVLLTELTVIVLLAQPLGWLLGYLFSWSMVKGFESDLFRIPLIINPSTFATASIVVIAAAVGSALIVRRRIDRLDLIRVLKTRE